MNTYMTRIVSKENEGWFYSKEFHHWQKVNNKVYVYVRPMLFNRWTVQLYLRGTASLCSLEAQINDSNEYSKLFELGEKWLEKYGDDTSELTKDPYYPFDTEWQGRDITGKALAY